MNSKKYDAIFIGGNPSLIGGRIIAGFRLRTALQKYGYNMLVIDNSSAMSHNELIQLLNNVITEETLLIGFSTQWVNHHDNLEWANKKFFCELKNNFPKLKLVAGGGERFWVNKSKLIYDNCDWVFTGFSDDSFPKFLDYLSKKPNHGFKYFIDNGKKVVASNAIYPVPTPNDIATIYELEDNFLPYQPIPLEVSRGCIFSCSFCQHPFQAIKDPDKYIRTPDNLSDELKRNYEMFGTTRYTILDDTFNDSMEKLDRLHRAIDLAKLPKFEFVSYIKPELLVTKPQMIPKLIDLGLCSGFIGLESLKHETRKIVHKGMHVGKILDVIANVRSKSNITFEASLIVGLPYESLDEVSQTQDFLIKNKKTLFTSWYYQPLSLFYNTNFTGMSEMDKNPEKFGYTILKKQNNTYSSWKNEYTNVYSATKFVNDINKETLLHNKVAGWQLATAWHLNVSADDISNTVEGDLNLQSKALVSNSEMAKKTLSKFGITPIVDNLRG